MLYAYLPPSLHPPPPDHPYPTPGVLENPHRTWRSQISVVKVRLKCLHGQNLPWEPVRLFLFLFAFLIYFPDWIFFLCRVSPTQSPCFLFLLLLFFFLFLLTLFPACFFSLLLLPLASASLCLPLSASLYPSLWLFLSQRMIPCSYAWPLSFLFPPFTVSIC